MDKTLVSTTRTGKEENIHDFLAKAKLFHQGTWTTEVAGADLYTVDLPDDVFTNTLWANKFHGFRGIRGTFVVWLKVNASPMQQGRLIMHYVPLAMEDNMYPGMRNRSLRAVTQQPRVEVDISCDTSAVLRIPYVNPYPFYDLDTNTNRRRGMWGRLYVTVYANKATGTGSTACGINVWIAMEDVELTTPCYYAAEMGDYERQASGKNVSEEESQHFISTTLSNFAKVARGFSVVPSLSSIAGTASWAIDALSGSARAFGYSKPQCGKAAERIYQMPNPNMENCDGIDFAPVFGLSMDNKIDILPGFAGSDKDEMNILSIVTRPAYHSTTAWTTAQAAGTLLDTFYLDPNHFSTLVAAGTHIYRDTCPLSFMAMFFQYWRGSIEFTLKFVKTRFHSGRLLIIYNPATTTPTVNASQYCFREIVDIREKNEIKIRFPFVSMRQYHGSQAETANPTVAAGLDYYGIVRIYIDTALVCPDTVSSSISYLLEVNGAEDFEFSCPKAGIQAIPFLTNAMHAAEMGDYEFHAEMGETGFSEQAPCLLEDLHDISSSSFTAPTLGAARYVAGEKITSILQLLKRYTSAHTTASLSSAVNAVNWRCFTAPILGESDTTASTTTPGGDYYNIFAPCFVFQRGSLRVMIQTPSNLRTSPTTVYADPSEPTVLTTDSTWWDWLMPTHIFPNSSSTVPNQCAQVPGYQMVPVRPNRLAYLTEVPPIDELDTTMRVRFMTIDTSGAASVYQLYRAVADDFSFGYFIGTPPVTVSYTAP